MPYRRERLRVETARHVIEGVLQLPTEGYRSRVTDYLNAHDSDFIALTEATVTTIAGGEVTERAYVAVNLRHAVLVVELESLGVVSEGRTAAHGIATLAAPLEPEPASVPPPGVE